MRMLILVPLSIVLLTLLGFSIFTLHWFQRNTIADSFNEKIISVNEMFHRILDEDAEKLNVIADFLKTDKNFQNAWLAKDREKLLRHAMPIYKNILSVNQITHFYFIGTDKICFLRAHKPDRYGDLIDRFTLKQASTENAPSYGIEMGPLGTFTLRVVHPWLMNGKTAGYIEVGEEIEHIAPRLKKIFGVDLFFAITKQYLDRTQWEAGMRMMERQSEWDQFSSFVVIDKTSEKIPVQIGKCLDLFHPDNHANGVIYASESEKKYRAKCIPLIDAGNQNVGNMIVVKDTTEEELSLKRSSLFLLFLSLLIGGSLIGFFYFYVGLIELKLKEMYDHLRTEIEFRKSAEESATENAKKYKALFDHANDSILLIDIDTGVLMDANKEAERLLGRSKNEIIGMHRSEIHAPDQEERYKYLFYASIDSHRVIDFEAEILRQDGITIPVRISSNVLELQGKKIIQCLFRDISESKKLESMVFQSEKLAAVGQLAAGVAHEINNPLGVIIGFVQSICRRIKPGDILEMPLKSIEREAIRCKDLVQDLLIFSRVDKGGHYPLDMNKTIEDALNLITAKCKVSNVEIQTKLFPEIPHISGNSNQIQQVIINLANNAIDAMPNGGMLEISTEVKAQSWVYLKISDTGNGIPADIRSKIFEPFFTTKEVGKGTGLGLSLVYEIVKKHSGTIDLQSRPGFTEFCLKFPVFTE